MGAMLTVEFCKERGVQDIILEGDSLQVVQGLNERTPSWRRYGHLIDDTRALLGTYSRWMVHHVKRDANRAAHGLAKEGLRIVTERQWIDESPKCISAIVFSELNAPTV
jgi:ribonuclease HI